METNDKGLEICKSIWNPDDQLDHLAQILQETSPENLKNTLIQYVVENIEPVGWRGLWRPTTNGPDMNDYLVEVNHVELNALEAQVIILSCIGSGKQYYEVNEKRKVDLLQLYPLAEQENPHVDLEDTTEVLEQLRFVYDHIWLPWDPEENICYDYPLLADRMKVYLDGKRGVIPTMILKEMDAAVYGGRLIRDRIDELEQLSNVSDVPVLFELHHKLDAFKYRYTMLKDPVLREAAILQKQAQRSALLNRITSVSSPKVLIVGSQVSPVQFMTEMARLNEILQSLPNYYEEAKIHTLPTLQIALDFASKGDTVVLLPGQYVLNNIGELAKGGSICGLGNDVKIGGSWASGDVLCDVESNVGPFSLYGLTIFGYKKQTAIMMHSGKLDLVNCTFQGCKIAVCILEKASATMKNCVFKDSIEHDVQVSKKAVVSLIQSDPKIYYVED